MREGQRPDEIIRYRIIVSKINGYNKGFKWALWRFKNIWKKNKKLNKRVEK